MVSQMEFSCKLAHKQEVHKLGGFNSAIELHQSISKSFSVPLDEILFCTLNTHNPRNMDALLGNYLSLGDLIVVHVCGGEKEVNLMKQQEHIGLTITDNGHGRAFVKRVKSNNEEIEKIIKVGDHIAAINGESTFGSRHYEVAKAIRDIPVQASFSIKLIEPKFCNENNESGEKSNDSQLSATVNADELGQNTKNPSNNSKPKAMYQIDSSNLDESIEMSLPIDRLLCRSANRQSFVAEYDSSQKTTSFAKVNHNDSVIDSNPYRTALKEINLILESFLGINDDTLAIQIYRFGVENKNSYESFYNAIDESQLNAFNFDKSIMRSLWNIVNNQDVRS